MANHKSSIKRIRSNEAKRLRNKYQAPLKGSTWFYRITFM